MVVRNERFETKGTLETMQLTGSKYHGLYRFERNNLPRWRWRCCCAANAIDAGAGGTTRTARSDSRLESAMKVWDSSSDEEEEGNEVEVINPVMEMQ